MKSLSPAEQFHHPSSLFSFKILRACLSGTHFHTLQWLETYLFAFFFMHPVSHIHAYAIHVCAPITPCHRSYKVSLDWAFACALTVIFLWVWWKCSYLLILQVRQRPTYFVMCFQFVVPFMRKTGFVGPVQCRWCLWKARMVWRLVKLLYPSH